MNNDLDYVTRSYRYHSRTGRVVRARRYVNETENFCKQIREEHGPNHNLKSTASYNPFNETKFNVIFAVYESLTEFVLRVFWWRKDFFDPQLKNRLTEVWTSDIIQVEESLFGYRFFTFYDNMPNSEDHKFLGYQLNWSLVEPIYPVMASFSRFGFKNIFNLESGRTGQMIIVFKTMNFLFKIPIIYLKSIIFRSETLHMIFSSYSTVPSNRAHLLWRRAKSWCVPNH